VPIHNNGKCCCEWAQFFAMPSGDAVCVNAEVEINVLDNNIAVHLKPRSHCMQRHTSTQDTADAKLYAITITIVGHIYMTSMCVK